MVRAMNTKADGAGPEARFEERIEQGMAELDLDPSNELHRSVYYRATLFDLLMGGGRAVGTIAH